MSFWKGVGKFFRKAAPVIGGIAGSFIPGLGNAVGAALGGAIAKTAADHVGGDALKSADQRNLGGILGSSIIGAATGWGSGALAGQGSWLGSRLGYGNQAGSAIRQAATAAPSSQTVAPVTSPQVIARTPETLVRTAASAPSAAAGGSPAGGLWGRAIRGAANTWRDLTPGQRAALAVQGGGAALRTGGQYLAEREIEREEERQRRLAEEYAPYYLAAAMQPLGRAASYRSFYQ